MIKVQSFSRYFVFSLALLPLTFAFQNCSSKFDSASNTDALSSLSAANDLPSVTNQANLTVQFSPTDTAPTTKYICRFDAEPEVDCSKLTFDIMNAAEGNHTVSFRTVFKSGRRSVTQKYVYAVDLTPPTLTVSTRPVTLSSSRNAQVTLIGADALSGFDKYECSLNGAAFTNCQSTINYTNQADARYTLLVRAVDIAGNRSAETSVVWTVDTTAPVLAFASRPAAATSLRVASFEFTGTDAGSMMVNFECKLDGGNFAPCTSPVNLTALAEGTHTYTVRGSDPLMQKSELTATWIVDATFPTAPVITPNVQAVTKSKSATLAFVSSDMGGSGIAKYFCKIDGGTEALCTSARNLTALAEGSHSFAVRAEDGAGNSSTTTTFNWTVDSIAPLTPVLTDSVIEPAMSRDHIFTFSSSDVTSGIAGYECSLDGAAFSTCRSPMTISAATNTTGIHTFRVIATDRADNDSAIQTRTFQTLANPASTLYHIVLNGQSLGNGSQALPIVSTSPLQPNLFMFTRTERTWIRSDNAATPELRPNSQFSLIPLQENRFGEMILSSLSATFQTGVKDDFNANDRPLVLASYSGLGGRTLRELDKRHDASKDFPMTDPAYNPGGHYKTSIDDVKRASTQAIAMGKTLKVPAVYWMQGEANGRGILDRYGAVLPIAEFLTAYGKELSDLAEDYRTDIKAVTGQTNVPFITYQTTSSLSGTSQLIASEKDPFMYMSGPTYYVASAINSNISSTTTPARGSNVHLTADGSRWFGCQMGKVTNRILLEGEDWKPLQPKTVKRGATAKEILIQYHVPRPPLVLDTTFLPKAVDFGFTATQVIGTTRSLLSITTVAVMGADTIKITVASDIPTSAAIEVGYGENRIIESTSINVVSIANDTAAGVYRITADSPVPTSIVNGLKEGIVAFNTASGGGMALVTSVSNVSGRAVYVVKRADMTNPTAFTAGMRMIPMRPLNFGNLRDSDAATCGLEFTDKSYNSRSGLYPLWNWGTIFTRFSSATPYF